MADVTEWVWVKDLSTGYRYDIPAAWLDADGRYEGVQVLAAKDRHFGPLPRDTKYPTIDGTDSADTTTRTTTTTDASASGDDAAAAASS